MRNPLTFVSHDAKNKSINLASHYDERWNVDTNNRIQVVGFAGISGAGKTTAAGILTQLMIRRGFSVKLDTFAHPVRIMADKEFGVTCAMTPERRTWMQTAASLYCRNNPDAFISSLIWRNPSESTNFLIIYDVRRQNEVEFCRRHGVVIYLQGTHRPLDESLARHESETGVIDLFHGADHIIPKQPSLSRLTNAIEELVEAGLLWIDD